MPFIEVKLDAKESKAAPEGRYPLRIIKCDEAKTGEKSKNPGERYYKVMIANESPDAAYMPIFFNLMLPGANQDEQVQRLRKIEIQRLLHQFNVPGDANGFDTDDLIGASAEGMVTLGTDDKDQPRNELRLDRLPDDEEHEEEAAPRGRRGRAGRNMSAEETKV